jgi:hypothetical protein
MDRVIQTFQASLPARFGIIETGDPLVAFGMVDFKNARPNFIKLMNILENKELRERGEGSPPLFFSQNLSSLLTTLARANRVKLEQRRPTPKRLAEVVTYQWEP